MVADVTELEIRVAVESLFLLSEVWGAVKAFEDEMRMGFSEGVMKDEGCSVAESTLEPAWPFEVSIDDIGVFGQ